MSEVLTHFWGQVTDPNMHNPEQFRYLVWAYNPISKASLEGLKIVNHIRASGDRRIRINNPEEGDQSIDLSEEPERLNERISISMSLIDQDHNATFGGAGLIIGAPVEKIICSSSLDRGTSDYSLELLLEQSKGQKVLKPNELLDDTDSSRYNHVVALAKSGHGDPLKLLGFFSIVDNKRVDTEKTAEKIKEQAIRLNLPLVEL